MTRIGDVIRYANRHSRGQEINWSVFDPPAGCDVETKRLWDGAKLLALSLDGGDPAKVLKERAYLTGLAHDYIAARQAGAGEPVAPSFTHRLGHGALVLAACVAAAPLGLVAGHLLGKVARSSTGGYVIRSTVRAFIYKAVGVFTR